MSELNLLPYELRNKKQKLIANRNLGFILILVLAVLVMGILALRFELNLLKSRDEVLKLEIKKSQNVLDERNNLIQSISGINKYLGKVEEITKQKIMITPKVREIEKDIPPDVKLTMLSYTADGISLSASSGNYSSLCIFCANLEMDGNYKDVRVNNISKSDKVGYQCNITISGVK
jgi:Tfp pilus assembly protein PilN